MDGSNRGVDMVTKRAGAFREDLYFRLGRFVIAVPPLRDRREDISSLVRHFLQRAAQRLKTEEHRVVGRTNRHDAVPVAGQRPRARVCD